MRIQKWTHSSNGVVCRCFKSTEKLVENQLLLKTEEEVQTIPDH